MKTLQLTEAAIIEIENLFKERIVHLQQQAHDSKEGFVRNAYGQEVNRINKYWAEFTTQVEGGH